MISNISGEIVRNAIKQAGLTMEEAAQKLGISRQTLYFQVGKANVPKELIEKVKECLDIDLTEQLDPNFVVKLKTAFDAVKTLFHTSVAEKIQEAILTSAPVFDVKGQPYMSAETSKTLRCITILEDSLLSDAGQIDPVRMELRHQLIDFLKKSHDLRIAQSDQKHAEQALAVALEIGQHNRTDIVIEQVKAREQKTNEALQRVQNLASELTKIGGELNFDISNTVEVFCAFALHNSIKIFGTIETGRKRYFIPLLENNARIFEDLKNGKDGLIEILQNYHSKKVLIPGFEDCDFAINAWGGALLPRYQNGDMIMCKFIEKDKDWTSIRFGEPYLIFFNDGVSINRIGRAVDDMTRLSGGVITEDNIRQVNPNINDLLCLWNIGDKQPAGPEEWVRKDMIVTVCLIKAVISRLSM